MRYCLKRPYPSLIHSFTPSRHYPSLIHTFTLLLFIELPSPGGEFFEQRSRFPELAMNRVETPHRLQDLVQADGVGIEHRATAIAREAVTVDVDDVDVGCPQCNALFQDFCALVDQRVDAALEDLLVGDRAALDPRFLRGFEDQCLDRGIGNRRAIAWLIAVPACTGCLTEAPELADLVSHFRIAQVWWARRCLALADVPAHIETGEVADAERAHGKAEILDHLVHLLRKRAFLEQEAGFAEIAVQHPVADEAVADAGDHADLLDGLGKFHRRCQRFLRGLRGAHHLQQLHHVGWTEEMQPQHVLRPRRHGGDLIDVQGRSIGGEDGTRLGALVELLEYLLLDRHVLEYGFDHDVGVLDVFVAGHTLEQSHAFVHGILAQPALGHGRRVILAHDGQTLVQRLLVHFQHFHRNAGIGEVHRDAATHRTRTDQRRGLDLVRRRVLRHIGNLGYLALGKEQVPQRTRLVGPDQFLELLALECNSLDKRLIDRSFD